MIRGCRVARFGFGRVVRGSRCEHRSRVLFWARFCTGAQDDVHVVRDEGKCGWRWLWSIFKFQVRRLIPTRGKLGPPTKQICDTAENLKRPSKPMRSGGKGDNRSELRFPIYDFKGAGAVQEQTTTRVRCKKIERRGKNNQNVRCTIRDNPSENRAFCGGSWSKAR